MALTILSGCAGGQSTSVAPISIATPFSDPARDREVTVIYEAAKRHNSAQLLLLAAALARDHKPPDPAVTLGLYVIDPTAHVTDFVSAYPTDTVGVQLDYGTRLDDAHLVPAGRLFPIRSLSALAIKGNQAALTKLLAAFTSVGDPLADAYGHEIAHVGAIIPREMLTTIAALPPAQQLEITAIPDWCAHRPNILALSPGNLSETKVQKEIHQRLADCRTPPPRKKHKRPRPRHAHKPTGKHPITNKPTPKHLHKTSP